uniref:Uncharacterized protein n=1 Tax=Anguilla anguilla TaxID=7936 RepID=A0A0E9V2Z4_ANGAN
MHCLVNFAEFRSELTRLALPKTVLAS